MDNLCRLTLRLRLRRRGNPLNSDPQVPARLIRSRQQQRQHEHPMGVWALFPINTIVASFVSTGIESGTGTGPG